MTNKHSMGKTSKRAELISTIEKLTGYIVESTNKRLTAAMIKRQTKLKKELESLEKTKDIIDQTNSDPQIQSDIQISSENLISAQTEKVEDKPKMNENKILSLREKFLKYKQSQEDKK